MVNPPVSATQSVPLCVDLDGTVINTDSLLESILLAVKAKPLVALLLPIWALRGRAHLKEQIARRVSLDATTLPYNQDLLEYLRQEKSAGRRLILVTASHGQTCKCIADHLGIFDEVLATEGEVNLKGENKAAELVKRFGRQGFDYAGDSTADLPVWEASREAVLVNCSQGIAEQVQRQTRIAKSFNAPIQPLAVVRALRVHQWAKNVIVFLPLVASHRIFEARALLACILAFIAFCCCASGAYILNDMLDLPADRAHPKKRTRPFASGALPLRIGLMLSPLLMLLGFGIGAAVHLPLAAVLAVYIVLTIAYSSFFRSVMLMDVFVLATLYTIRLIGGHEAAQVVYSKWLLGFSIFLFLSLGLLKRAAEVLEMRERVKDATAGRGYRASDLEVLSNAGMASGSMAVLILAVYVSSPEMMILYNRPYVLLLLCPLMFYWLIRLWLIVHRGNMHSDPVVFALRDRVTYYVLIAAALLVIAASKAPIAQ